MNGRKISRAITVAVMAAPVGLVIFASLLSDGVPAKPKADTTGQLMKFKASMIAYHGAYGVYPVRCGNVDMLADVLQGRDIEGLNPKQMSFLPVAQSGHRKAKSFVDGWGHELIVQTRADGTNMVIRSVGRNGIDDKGALDDTDLRTDSF